MEASGSEEVGGEGKPEASWSCPEATVGRGVIHLRLGPFCIETTARRARERLVAALLADEATGDELEDAVELLGEFLRGEDFSQLRAGDPALTGDRRCTVELDRSDDGQIRWRTGRGEKKTESTNTTAWSAPRPTGCLSSRR